MKKMTKKLGYYLFAMLFCVFRICPVRKDKVFFVATHDDSEEGNIGIVAQAIRRQMPHKKLVFLTKKDGVKKPFQFFFCKAYHMATSATIFLDNEFMPMAYTPFSSKTNVVQLWHGTGTIKKFGQDSDVGEVARLAHRANTRLTHLIVNSEMTKRQYASAFNMPPERVHILGLPRTDLILNQEKMQKKRENFFKQFPELEGKRCLLYAPTFRDREVENPKVALELDSFVSNMAEDEVLLLRFHPHVAANLDTDMLERYEGRVYSMSHYKGVMTLLAVADCLITDYSSIVFEYCLLNKKMIFYAYDLEQFEKEGRSFYEDYETFVPGPVVRNQQQLEKECKNRSVDLERLHQFQTEMFSYLDCQGTERLFELIFKQK